MNNNKLNTQDGVNQMLVRVKESMTKATSYNYGVWHVMDGIRDARVTMRRVGEGVDQNNTLISDPALGLSYSANDLLISLVSIDAPSSRFSVIAAHETPGLISAAGIEVTTFTSRFDALAFFGLVMYQVTYNA